ncbi:hypothetical protein MTR_3g102000 [Medicago truncatula]|uniref:BIRD-IDD transcription factor second C2H2 zinc finger domain-containing protein n=1 Tax=Medicago truncatula TaxID=3880 RepID=G7J6X7_MEDTR|nr:hypothetical protein MTR_3g102000 [Medicago truncatula]
MSYFSKNKTKPYSQIDKNVMLQLTLHKTWLSFNLYNRYVIKLYAHAHPEDFQRNQNLQLHRRGYNLPWKLKQRTSKEIRKRVYVCPEKTRVHNHPSRALGDLTGIKKHFCRNHSENKWKCSKFYAVQSDWKDVTELSVVVVERAQGLIDDWQKANVSQLNAHSATVQPHVSQHNVGQQLAQWQPPRLGRFKCNVDAAFSEQFRRTGIEICLRDETETLCVSQTDAF